MFLPLGIVLLAIGLAFKIYAKYLERREARSEMRQSKIVNVRDYTIE
jgi:hypothetical protein